MAQVGKGSGGRNKVVTADEAVRLIRDGDSVAVDGFMGQCFAEELVLALEQRFVETGSPTQLSLTTPVCVGDKAGRGIDHLAHPGLLRRVTAGHWGMSPGIQKLATQGEIEAYNLPQGVIAQIFRDTAGGRPGLLTDVGLGTFVDPRNGGGKINDRTTEDVVELIELGGEEHLFYRSPKLDVAFLRGTTADAAGNVTMEHEALLMEALAVATAVHNCGGLVIVQVERLAESGSLSPRDVIIPAALVDCVVLSQPEHHWQTMGTPFSSAFSGELRVPLGSFGRMPLDPRKVIARRAACELRPGMVVNLGVGTPEGVANVANEEGILSHLTLTAEPGVIGGLPQAGLDFGSALNAEAVLDQPSQFDFYDGGGLDLAVLGMAQADQHGNVNVSRFGGRLPGAGGFINISSSASRIVFVGTFLAPGLTTVVDGALAVDEGDATVKICPDVEQITFSGSHGLARRQEVLYVTERCVFRLGPEGLELTEIAPGLDLERDVLAHLAFTPAMPTPPVEMDARLFDPEPMGLDAELLEIPLPERCTYDEDRNLFFLNLEGLGLYRAEDVRAIADTVEAALAPIGHTVHMVINYDNFFVTPELEDAYLAAVQELTGQYYESVTRYTTSSFLRLKLSDGLDRRGLAPHVHETRAEASTR